MTAESFAERWSRKQRDCGFGDVEFEMIPCGPDVLPDSAAPCLSFPNALRPMPIWEVFASPADWTPADRERLDPYRMIGSDGSGNPICVDQGTGAVVLLDHEDRFKTRLFINSSVAQLAECLLAYMGEQTADRFRTAVEVIDPAGIAEGSFWWCEVAGLSQ